MDKHNLQTDILIAGGGMAGVCCALAAARNGAKVILCQDRAVLGGNASSEMRMHICGAAGYRGVELETEAREGGIIEEIRLDCAANNPQSSFSVFDLILYDKCITNDNIQLLLNTSVVGCKTENSMLKKVFAQRQSTEDEFEIEADIFVDCTGDSRLAFEAGAELMTGREDKKTYGEKLALDKPDAMRLGSSILFRARDMGKAVKFTAPSWARKFTKSQLRKRPIYGYESGYWWLEYGGTLDTIKDAEKIHHELLAILMGIWDYIKNSNEHPMSENYALDWFGAFPQKRESRRIKGKTVLTQNQTDKAFFIDDVIAYGGWPYDSHPPGGVYDFDKQPCSQPLMPYLYPIPVSCCISNNIKNLMFAGRNISASHVVFSSARVMATCSVIGQGVGTFASQCVKFSATPADAYNDAAIIKSVHRRLLYDDAFLPGLHWDNDADIAKRAVVKASSEQQEGLAKNVIDGYTRAVYGKGGTNPKLSSASSHRWMSKAEDKKPWIDLKWDQPVDINSIRIIFDTGMHRRLALTQEESFRNIMIWGTQPETVKDYRISAGSKKLKSVLKVKDNYQRINTHYVQLKSIDRLRIDVDAVNGIDHSRIFEIICL